MSFDVEKKILSAGTIIYGPDGQFYEVIKDLPYTAPKSDEYLKEHGGAPFPGTDPQGPTIPPWAALEMRKLFGVETPSHLRALYTEQPLGPAIEDERN